MNEPVKAEEELFDVTIIGGGPAGMYAAFYAGMRDMKVKLIEGKGELGGFLHTYPEKMIWDVGGIPPIRCEALIAQLAGQAATFAPALAFNQRVDELQQRDDGTFVLVSDTGERHWSRTIIIAVGRGITEMQRLEVEGADRYELANLYYTVQELNVFRGRNVLISGGGNSAVDWALELADVAAQVTVVHRSGQFRALERNVAAMRERTKVLAPYRVVQLHGGEEEIRQVTVAHMESGASERIDVDAVIVNHGYKSSYGSLVHWGLDAGEYGLYVSERAETSLPGIFAAGDCAAYGSKVRLIAGAFADAVLAVNSAKRYLEPDAPGMAEVSSHNERFKERNKQLHRKR